MLTFDPDSHSFTLDGLLVPSVTQVLAPLSDSGASYYMYMESARRRGVAVHEATERYDRLRGALRSAWKPNDASMAATVAPYLAAWQKFLADTDFEVHAIEEMVSSKRHRYAGILDRLGVLNGQRVVIDIKTNVVIKPVMGLQLAAYQAAANEGRPKAEQYPQRFICQLRKDGNYRLEEFRDRADMTVFLALLTIWNWKALHEGGGA
jgi:hypothetical protein